MNISELLAQTLEIEGLIRILQERYDADAASLLTEKIDRLKYSAAADDEVEAPVSDTQGESPAPHTQNESPSAPEETPAPAAAIADEYAGVIRVEDVISKAAAGNFGSAFSINDKFRFIRELFGGDSQKFTATIGRVERMESLDQAYDYFLNELEWDADDGATSDFLMIVANHFNSMS